VINFIKDKKWPSISKGGPGSGRYPAGSGGNEAPAKESEETYYHGTTEERARSILKEGLIPFKHFEFDVKTRMSELLGGSEGKVFASTDRKNAVTYAKDLREMKGLKVTPAIVTIKIPKNKMISDVPNDLGLAPYFYHIGKIPAKYVESISVFFKGKWTKVKKEINKDDDIIIFYIVANLKED